ncbi:MAG: hypothetical protein U5R06_01860 [candidate division KSB1 bacterium]|nr:hypothetical protein [candidate division KSB1 bacterium]
MYTRTMIVFLFIMINALSAQTLTDSARPDSLSASDSLATHPDVTRDDTRLFIDKIEVKGELEKPQAVFFLPGQTPEIDDINIERSFFNEIFRPIDKQSVVETKYMSPGTQIRRDVIEW